MKCFFGDYRKCLMLITIKLRPRGAEESQQYFTKSNRTVGILKTNVEE
jgi:hypothetical protein